MFVFEPIVVFYYVYIIKVRKMLNNQTKELGEILELGG